jgi:hypothetical protein
MHADIQLYNTNLNSEDKIICDILVREIDSSLPEAESKIWHAHPVWFIESDLCFGAERALRKKA